MRSAFSKSFHLMASVVMLAIAAVIAVPPWIGEGSGLHFENPWFLLGFLAVPLVVAAGMFEKRFAGRIRFPLASVIRKSGVGFRAGLLPFSTGLRATGIALLVVALARPQDANRPAESELEGIDIVVTMDLSGSMDVSDLKPTRLEASKAVVQDFIKRRKNDRIGAVIFAKDAYTLCPLTLDYNILASMLKDLTIGVIDGESTSIGNAVGVSINRLRKSEAKSRVIILLTDGTSNSGNITPSQAAEFAKTLGIKIYTVLMGSQNDAPLAQARDFFNRTVFGTSKSPINPELLRDMSEQTGGAFFEATDTRGLKSSFHSILDELERSKITDQGVAYAEAFPRYLWPALILLALDLLLGISLLRRIP